MERVTRVEEGLHSLGRSLDSLARSFEQHLEQNQHTLDELRKDQIANVADLKNALGGMRNIPWRAISVLLTGIAMIAALTGALIFTRIDDSNLRRESDVSHLRDEIGSSSEVATLRSKGLREVEEVHRFYLMREVNDLRDLFRLHATDGHPDSFIARLEERTSDRIRRAEIEPRLSLLEDALKKLLGDK